MLKLKSWQLFLIFLIPTAIPFLFPIEKREHGMMIGAIIWALIYIYWLDNLGTNLFMRCRKKSKINIQLFKFNTLFIFIYIFVIVALKYLVDKKTDINPGILVVIMCALSLYAVIGILAILSFVCKVLITVEERQLATFDQYAVEFIFLLFFPIGIWWLQPRINTIFSRKRIHENLS